MVFFWWLSFEFGYHHIYLFIIIGCGRSYWFVMHRISATVKKNSSKNNQKLKREKCGCWCLHFCKKSTNNVYIFQKINQVEKTEKMFENMVKIRHPLPRMSKLKICIRLSVNCSRACAINVRNNYHKAFKKISY